MTAVMRPAQGSPAFHATASAWVRRTISGPWTTTAPGAKSRAAASLSPALIALLHARATLSGDAGCAAGLCPPQPAARAAAASEARTRLRNCPDYSPAVDFGLSADQREIQGLAHEVAQAEIAPHAATWDGEHRFPRELYAKLGELGLMGVCVPEEYGGSGADFLAYILVLEELSRADAGVGVTVAVH